MPTTIISGVAEMPSLTERMTTAPVAAPCWRVAEAFVAAQKAGWDPGAASVPMGERRGKGVTGFRILCQPSGISPGKHRSRHQRRHGRAGRSRTRGQSRITSMSSAATASAPNSTTSTRRSTGISPSSSSITSTMRRTTPTTSTNGSDHYNFAERGVPQRILLQRHPRRLPPRYRHHRKNQLRKDGPHRSADLSQCLAARQPGQAHRGQRKIKTSQVALVLTRAVAVAKPRGSGP